MKQESNNLLRIAKLTGSAILNIVVINIVVVTPLVFISSLLNLNDIWFILIGTQISFLIYGLFLISFDYKYLLEKFTKKVNIAYILTAIGLVVAYFIINIAITKISGPIVSNTTSEIISTGNMKLTLLVTGFMAPIAEELAFRVGLKRKIIDEENLSNLTFILLSGFIFGLFHWQPGIPGLIIVLMISIMGMLNGLVYIKTENILIPIASHMLYNVIIFSLVNMV